MTQRIGTQFYGFPQTWLGRVLGGLLAAALLVAAFFFLFLFLLVLGVLILAVLLRLFWRARKVRTQASQDILEGEYSVEPHAEGILDGSATDITHKH
jgi:predicted lipid-binding transport protein (Tim44 family)